MPVSAFLVSVSDKLLEVGRVAEGHDVVRLEDRVAPRESGKHLTHVHLARATRDLEASRMATGKTEQVRREHAPGKMLCELLAHEP